MLEVLKYYTKLDELVSITPLKIGLIHDSFHVKTNRGSYFFQKINHKVFANVQGMMSNIHQVTHHLSTHLDSNNYSTLKLVSNDEGRFHIETKGEYWRAYEYLIDLFSKELPTNVEEVKSAAKAFSAFTATLTSLDSSTLVETIPNFHSLSSRISQLDRVLKAPVDKRRDVIELSHEIKDTAVGLLPLEIAWVAGKIPTRITHNDTKFNNVLFDRSGNARCVVDLDTVMPGIIHFDLGDALRTLAVTADESEQDLRRVTLKMEYLENFVKHYLDSLEHILQPEELSMVPMSAPYMSIIMAVRFITDHLQGNVYYNTRYEGHNLVRAKNQLHVTKLFLNDELGV